jgi:hypothetical protein
MRLLKDLDGLETSDAAAAWAQRVLATKSTMTAPDAQSVEQAFGAKLATLTTDVRQGIKARANRASPQDRRCAAKCFAATPLQRD